jgi:transposase-like protein
MGRKQKFSKEIKIKACEKYYNGKGSFKSIAKEVGCNESVLRRWYYAYKEHGSSIFNSSHKNNSYDKEFKLSLIESYLNGNYSMMELAASHNISYSIVQRWIKKYNDGIEIKSYDPKGEVYTMKARETTYEERLEIAKWVISNDMNYKEAADRYRVNYALVYKWTKSCLKDGEESLQYKKRGPKEKSSVNECDLREVEQLRKALEKEIALRKRRELEIEILKKKEEFEKKLRYRR